jgi:1-acyl-sn-glycerol-3-phosphate acyltransferase
MITLDRPVSPFVVFSTRLAQLVVSLGVRLLLLLFCRFQTRGLENLNGVSSRVIFAANHTNDLDSLLIRASLPLFTRHSPLFAVARQTTDYTWRGWRKLVYRDKLFHFLGAYPAYKGTRDYATSLRLIVHIAKSGYPILIFTGGKQWKQNEPVKSRGGTGYLAWETEHVVVPVAVEGVFGITLRSFITSHPSITVSFGTPYTKAELFSSGLPTVREFQAASAKITREIDRMRMDAQGSTTLVPIPVRITKGK